MDLILEAAGRVFPVEIKRTATPSPRHIRPLSHLRKLVGEACEPGMLVCRVSEPRMLPGGVEAVPWQQWPERLEAMLGG